MLASIGEALGLDSPLPEWRAGSYTGAQDPSDRKAPHGGANQVLTGFAETGNGRVVWVEQHTGDLSDPEAVHYASHPTWRSRVATRGFQGTTKPPDRPSPSGGLFVPGA